MKALVQQGLVHWQSTLFGTITGLSGLLYAGTQAHNLSGPQFWALLLGSLGTMAKGWVSADASKVEAAL